MSEKPKVFVARQIPDVGIEKLCDRCDVDVWEGEMPPPRDVLLERIRGCEGVLTLLTDKVDAAFFDAAGSQLRVVSNFAVGYNNIDVDEATRRGIRVGNTPDVLTEATADIAMALLLTVGRRIVESQQYIRDGHWKTWEPMGHIGVDLQGKTLGILGMGRIGAALARRCRHGWGMNVLYHNRSRNEAAEQELDAELVSFDQLLQRSDFLSVHASLNDSTRHLFDRETFQKMKSTAVFINTARGPLHVQDDLREALETNEIFGAGLDVTDPEPMASDDPLLMMRNCVIAPHIGSATFSSRNGMSEIAADNLLTGLDGKPLRCWVNPTE